MSPADRLPMVLSRPTPFAGLLLASPSSTSPTTTASRPPGSTAAAPGSAARLDGVEVSVIAPDSNRSATARSITTRSPLWVEEVEFDDGTTGFATDGTPVDCVRFAELGLLGERPDLIVSGINHGANLGDDITYSGTVAAALEGIVLGIPAVAVSQQSAAREMDFRFGRSFDFDRRRSLTARGWSRRLATEPMPEGTLINVNCPAGEPTGVEVTQLGKRLYNDELKLVDEDETAGAATRSTASSPRSRTRRAPTSRRSPPGRISVTPVHFDLTDHGGLDRLRGWDLAGMLGSLAGRRAADAASSEAGRGRRERSPPPGPKRAAELRREILHHEHRYYVLDDPGDLRYRLRRPAARAARARGGAPRAAHPGLADPAGRRQAARQVQAGRAPRADALARQRPQRGGAAGLGEAAAQPARPARHRCGRPATSPSRRSTAWRSR